MNKILSFLLVATLQIYSLYQYELLYGTSGIVEIFDCNNRPCIILIEIEQYLYWKDHK